MRRTTWISLIVLTAVVVGLVVFLMREAMSGPTFRAADHATMNDCLAAIPSEWLRGSLERTGAETACHYEQERRLRRPGGR